MFNYIIFIHKTYAEANLETVQVFTACILRDLEQCRSFSN